MRSAQTVGFRLPGAGASPAPAKASGLQDEWRRFGEAWRLVVILPSAWVANVTKIVTFHRCATRLLRVTRSRWSSTVRSMFRRGDMIVSLESQPDRPCLRCAARCPQSDGIQPKRDRRRAGPSCPARLDLKASGRIGRAFHERHRQGAPPSRRCSTVTSRTRRRLHSDRPRHQQYGGRGMIHGQARLARRHPHRRQPRHPLAADLADQLIAGTLRESPRGSRSRRVSAGSSTTSTADIRLFQYAEGRSVGFSVSRLPFGALMVQRRDALGRSPSASRYRMAHPDPSRACGSNEPPPRIGAA